MTNKLWAAYDRLDSPLRWTKNQLAVKRNPTWDGPPVSRCLVGAIFRVGAQVNEREHDAIREIANVDPDCRLVAETIIEQYRPRLRAYAVDEMSVWQVLTWFNDCPQTTHEEVRAVLEKAAIKCDEVLS